MGVRGLAVAVVAGVLLGGVGDATPAVTAGEASAVAASAGRGSPSASAAPAASTHRAFAVAHGSAAARASGSTADAFTVATGRLPGAARLTRYSARLVATKAKKPVRWAVSSGRLPRGLTLSSGGVVSGAPTATGAAAFTVRATDATGASATRRVEMAVVPRGGLVLADPRIGPSRLGRTPAQTLAELRTQLGSPTVSRAGGGCELSGDTASHLLRWGDLWFVGQAPTRDAVRITTWTVNGPNLPAPISPPGGVRPGMTERELRRRVPDAKIVTDPAFGRMATSGRMVWWLDERSHKVTTMSMAPQLCE